MASLYPSSRDYSDLDFTPSGKASQEETKIIFNLLVS